MNSAHSLCNPSEASGSNNIGRGIGQTNTSFPMDIVDQNFDSPVIPVLTNDTQDEPQQLPTGAKATLKAHNIHCSRSAPHNINDDSTQTTHHFMQSVGHSYHKKGHQDTRFVFLNHNGIPLTATSLAEFLMNSQAMAADWIGIAESHLDSQKAHVRETFKASLQSPRGYAKIHCAFSASDLDFQTIYKRGGVLQVATNTLANRVVASFEDKMGRFTSQTFIGTNAKKLTALTGYRVGEKNSGPSSAFSQQHAMLVSAGRPGDPRKLFISDLTEHIQSLQLQGNSILLSLDANESSHKKSSGIQRLMDSCGLLDIHEYFFPGKELPSHRNGRDKIDFMLGTPDIIPAITRAGILAFNEGFSSDHRTMFIDLDLSRILKGSHTDVTHRANRSFTSTNKKTVKIIRGVITLEWERRQMSARIRKLSEISKLTTTEIRMEALSASWEKIDKEIGIIFQQAERALRIPKKNKYKWSPLLAKAGAEKQYWRARLISLEAGKQVQGSGLTLQKRFNIEDHPNLSIAQVKGNYDSAVKRYAEATKQDAELRYTHLDVLIDQLSQKRDPESVRELKAVKALKRAEQQQKLFAKLRQTLKPIASGAISRVDIPIDLAEVLTQVKEADDLSISASNNEVVREILQRTVQEKRQDSEEWVTLIDKQSLERAILVYCQEHFRQAEATPFGAGQLFDMLGHSGLTEAGRELLKGTLFENADHTDFPEIKEFITQLAIPSQLLETQPIPSEISLQDYSAAIQRWKESTSTSPSGRHLGFYKATLNMGKVTEDFCEMLNIVIRAGLIPSRWCKAVSVLLEKDPGKPNINRLRVIHLFEADYNLFLKILWARRLVSRGEEYNVFEEAQQGSRPGRKANDAVLLKRLTYDLTRILRTNLGTFDNDAKSCYDRIINSLAMLAAQRLGMPASAIATHSGVLKAMQYKIKTSFGVSDFFIQSMSGAFLFGTGQGSGASPAVWLSISIILLSAL